MATRLFLHATSNAQAGTFPTAEQSVTFSAKYTATGGNTLRTMNSLSGVSQTSLIVSTSSSATYDTFFGFFCSNTFDANQTVGAGAQTITLNVAREVSTGAASATAVGTSLYVWRPSTGAKVGTVYDGLLLPIGSAAGISERVYNGTISAAASVAALAGDVLVVELWQRLKPAAATVRTLTMYYDGTTVSTTHSTVVSNHASFLDFATDTLTFSQPPAVGAGSISCAAATLSATGRVAVAGAGSISCAAATLSATGGVAVKGSSSVTLGDAAVAATGTVAGPFTYGNFNATLGDATVAATGAARVTGAGNVNCAAATMAATGMVLVTGNSDQTLERATVAGTGTVVDGFSGITGTRVVTLERATVAATGSLGAAPSVPAPVLPRGSSGGSGASRPRKRKKFVIPDLSVEPVKTLNDILGIREEPASTPVPIQTLKPVKLKPLTEAVAASPPDVAQSSTLPNPSPVVVEEEYSDDDLMYLLLMVTP